QGELEHRTSKSRFRRTSGKSFTSQLASIEHQQACIRHICARREMLHCEDPTPNLPEVHYVIGKSQNTPEDVTQFVQKNFGDPAVKGFVQKLKLHLLPHIRDLHTQGHASDTKKHPFCYACVLGIYHANVIYIGPGTRDYQSRRQNFLWVCWFELLPDQHSGWQHTALDRARFVSMDRADTFSFVDPADMLWCCHLIPSFADGRLHPDSIATSCNAHESEDWKVYYINRFVDHDMMMRYHWGLAVGH
ncbi:hypothetical protein PISMIDRAFT_75455, partial [Pisolithus microcarpus 441]